MYRIRSFWNQFRTTFDKSQSKCSWGGSNPYPRSSQTICTTPESHTQTCKHLYPLRITALRKETYLCNIWVIALYLANSLHHHIGLFSQIIKLCYRRSIWNTNPTSQSQWKISGIIINCLCWIGTLLLQYTFPCRNALSRLGQWLHLR